MATTRSRRTPLTIGETADYLGVSLSYVDKRTRDGTLPAIIIPIGRKPLRRYDPDELDAWLDQYRTGAAPAGEAPEPAQSRRRPTRVTRPAPAARGKGLLSARQALADQAAARDDQPRS